MIPEIHKKIVVDENGEPSEVLIPWAEFQQLEEALGLDLSDDEADLLREAREDVRNGKRDAFAPLD